MTRALPLFQDPRPAAPPSREYEVRGRGDEVFRVRACVLGAGSSEADRHSHPGSAAARPGERCSACRWFEVELLLVGELLVAGCTCGAADAPGERPGLPALHRSACGRESPPGRFLVVTRGVSRVPGEDTLRRAVWTDSAFEVVELLVDRRTGRMPGTSARVVAQAAAYDAEMRAAYSLQSRRAA